MVMIKVISDDYGVQRLRADNQRAPTANAVTSIQGSRGIHQPVGAPTQPQYLPVAHPRIRRRLLAERRVQGDRRRRERRQQSQAVMLDTRSYRERRRTRQRRVRETTTNLPHGIDTEV